MGEIVVRIFAVVVLLICIICIIIAMLKVKELIGKLTTVIAALTVIVTLFPYFGLSLGGSNGVAMYYGDLEAFKEIQKNYTKITDKNAELNLAVKEKDETIANLKTQIKEVIQNGNSGVDVSEVSTGGIDFQDIATVLYSGSEYEKFDGTTNESFTVGKEEYRVGFTIYNDGGLFDTTGSSGYVLFDLEEKYKEMVCSVGRVNSGTDTQTLYITSSDGIVNMQFPVRPDASSQELKIPLNYAKDLKIALDTDMHVKCGFFNIKFYE